MTNLKLTVLIAAYCGNKEMDIYDNTETYRNQVTQLIDDGMIAPYLLVDRYRYKITEKGRFWLNSVLELPYPVEKKIWEIPK